MAGRRWVWPRWRLRVGSSLGQTTTEWLMIAGTLTAIAIILGTSMAATLRVFVRSIATSVRTIAP